MPHRPARALIYKANAHRILACTFSPLTPCPSSRAVRFCEYHNVLIATLSPIDLRILLSLRLLTVMIRQHLRIHLRAAVTAQTYR